jgi:hypothetical protein
MKRCIYVAYEERKVGIAFGVKVTVTKNRKNGFHSITYVRIERLS